MFSLLNDKEIFKLAVEDKMIEPFESEQVREVNGSKVISYGLSSYGYDMRISKEFKVFSPIHSTVVDPKNFDERCYVDIFDDYCIIPPNSFILAKSVEYFNMPKDIIAICLGKSTMARSGIIINVTPLEPGWCGYLTIEISNCTPLSVKIYSMEGIGQLLFFRGAPCKISYADRAGRYQNQMNITLPFV